MYLRSQPWLAWNQKLTETFCTCFSRNGLGRPPRTWDDWPLCLYLAVYSHAANSSCSSNFSILYSTRPWLNIFLVPSKSTSYAYIQPPSLTEASRSGFSDTTPTDVPSPAESDEEEVFTYPAHDDNEVDEHHREQEEEEEEEFVYPDSSVDATPHQDSLIVSDDSPEHSLLPPNFAVESTLVESPSLLSSPPQAQVPSHPSPAQLEALSAAASQGDLVLLKKLFATALQGGDLEAFALANDASSRTGFTALHAAASRGYLDIVKWRESWIASQPCTSPLTMSYQSLKTAVRYQAWKTAKAR